MLIATWSLGVAPPNMKTLGNVSFIVIGVVVASLGEIKFNMVGFMYQAGGIVFEAVRLVMVQRLLSSAEFKMDPLVSLYYYAPACAIMNGIVCMFTELPRLTMTDIYNLGTFTLLANAMVAFMLNVSVVFLVSCRSCLISPKKTGANSPTDRQDLLPGPHAFRCAEGYPARFRLDDDLPGPRLWSPGLWLQHCPRWSHLLQARCR